MASVHFKPHDNRSGSADPFGESDGFFPTQYPNAGNTVPASRNAMDTSAIFVQRSNSSQNAIILDDGGSAGAVEPHRTRFGHPADDLPILEELGIFPAHIAAKALAVLHPLRPMSSEVVEDTDLAGPVVFAISLGFLLSLQGKVQFGAIYGLSLLGIIFAKSLLGLMIDHSVPTQVVVSSLGYCLLPNLLLAAIQTVQYWLIGSNKVILPVAMLIVGWAAWCATHMFVRTLRMESQKFLILYPLVLFYAVFAALTIF